MTPYSGPMSENLLVRIWDDVWIKAFAILFMLAVLFRFTGCPLTDSEYFICFLLFAIIAMLDKIERQKIKAIKCPVCSGRGTILGTPPGGGDPGQKRCPGCDGKGWITIKEGQ